MGKISSDGEIVLKSQYMNCIQGTTKLYLGKLPQQNNITISTCTIVHPCLDVMTAIEAKNKKSVFNKNQSRRDIKRRPVCLTNSDNDFIIDEIKRRDTIEYTRKISVDNSYE